MHLKRWITGLTALPFLIYLIWKGSVPFAVFVAFIALLALGEYFRIAFHDRPDTLFSAGPLISLLTAPLVIWAAFSFPPGFLLCILALNLFLGAFLILNRFAAGPDVLQQVVQQTQAVIYIPVMLAFAVFIRQGIHGMEWIFFVLGVVFAGDIGALYAGSYLGKHKLCPTVSPKKTIEGAMGGLAANILIGLLIRGLVLPKLPVGGTVVFCICTGAAGQVGDLFESAFKRAAGIKDSGTILPGHGGILDRIDALLFALPVAYFFKTFIFV